MISSASNAVVDELAPRWNTRLDPAAEALEPCKETLDKIGIATGCSDVQSVSASIASLNPHYLYRVEFG